MKIRASLLISLMAGFLQAEAQRIQLLIAGTDVPVIATQSINAYELREGQMIDLATADDVKLESGEVAIPKGSHVSARVRTSLKQRVLANQKRRLIIDIKDVKLPNGTKIALSDGVVNFTTNKRIGDIDAIPLTTGISKKLQIPTNRVMHAKVEVSLDISKSDK